MLILLTPLFLQELQEVHFIQERLPMLPAQQIYHYLHNLYHDLTAQWQQYLVVNLRQILYFLL